MNTAPKKSVITHPTSSSLKVTRERPTKYVVSWLKKHVGESEYITVTLDKLITTVFRPVGITDVSAYLFFERWTKNRPGCLSKFGKLQCYDPKAGIYRFYFKAKTAPKPKPSFQGAIPNPYVGDGKEHPVVKMTKDIAEIKAATGIILDALASLTDKVNAIATKE